jgi:3-deoxy-D-manno-octulosonic-acid transferase
VNSWDRMTFNLPFSTVGIVMGDPIFVPSNASREQLEKSRREVEEGLNATTAKAYALAGADMTRATPVPRKRTP